MKNQQNFVSSATNKVASGYVLPSDDVDYYENDIEAAKEKNGEDEDEIMDDEEEDQDDIDPDENKDDAADS